MSYGYASAAASQIDTVATIVPAATAGSLYALSARLAPPITWTKLSGNANLTVSGSAIALAAGLAAGASQSIVVRGVSGTSAVEFQVTLTGEAVGGVEPTTVMAAFTRVADPTATGGTAANSLIHTSRSRHLFSNAPGDHDDLRVSYCNYYVDTTNQERGPGFATTLSVSVYIPALGGTPKLLKWNGADSKVLANGAGKTTADNFLPSDYLVGLAKFPKNSVCWLIAERTNVSGDTRVFAGFTGTGTPAGEGATTGPAGNPTQLYSTAALTAPAGGALSTSLFLPFDVHSSSTGHADSVLIVGNSIPYGQGELTLGAGDGQTAGGYMQRGLYGLGVAWALSCRPATSLYAFRKLGARRRARYPFYKRVHLDDVRNDIDGTNCTDAIFTATISGTTMTVTEVFEGTTLVAGDKVQGAGISGTPLIQAFGTAGTTGTGGTGTYALSTSQTVSSPTLLNCAKNGGRTAAQIEADLVAEIAVMKAAGIQFVGIATVAPKATSNLSITSLTASGSTCTAVTAAPHNLSVGQMVTINNASPTSYRGRVLVVSVADSTTFTYTAAVAPASSPATGTITFSDYAKRANQTVTPAYQAGDVSFDLNAKIAAVQIAGQDYSVLVSEALRDATEPGKWIQTDGLISQSDDGQHFNEYGHPTAAAVVNAKHASF